MLRKPNSRIALLAYTNKAVDEICEALESSEASISDQYIRIGSSTATGEKYRHKLFDQVICTHDLKRGD